MAMQAQSITSVIGVESECVAPKAHDTYFANEPNLIAPFDFNYDLIIDFKTRVGMAEVYFNPVMWCSCCCCYPCFLQKNIEWDARSQHLALTVDGIRYVKEKRKSCCGLPCTDRGRESKTVPYDKITDCDVQEPAGTACCCCIQNVLSVVNIDTASSGVGGNFVLHEMSLQGLADPHAFKHSVWAMKRRLAPSGAQPTQMGKSLSSPCQMEMHNVLLTAIAIRLKAIAG
ncbi:unnamed protein product [Durusdinium trenchii]|uniref:Phospholipid scramblase n=1 Tax=Durusdinium trenchii TaxID=1381693 RepID=A0ABP0JJ04_9DINO